MREAPWRERHIGEIIERVRSLRGIEQRELADRAGLAPSTLSRLERYGSGARGSYEKIVDALCAPNLDPALGPHDRELLLTLREADERREERRASLDALTRMLRAEQDWPDGLRDLHSRLEACAEPAMIIDPLWRIHAMNAPMSAIHAAQGWPADSWQHWHVVGTHCRPGGGGVGVVVGDVAGERMATATNSTDRAEAKDIEEQDCATVPVLVADMFRSPAFAAHYFTPQCATSVERLSAYPCFRRWWPQAKSLGLPFDEPLVVRVRVGAWGMFEVAAWAVPIVGHGEFAPVGWMRWNPAGAPARTITQTTGPAPLAWACSEWVG